MVRLFRIDLQTSYNYFYYRENEYKFWMGTYIYDMNDKAGVHQ